MMLPDLRSDVPKWTRLPNGSLSGASTQGQIKNNKIDQWRKRVEKAAEFGASPVLSRTKRAAGTGLSTQLSSSNLLRHQNDAHIEAQALLTEWMSTKIRLELDEDDEEDAPPCDPGSSERSSPLLFPSASRAQVDYDSFNDLYYSLAMEEEERAVSSILRELMQRDVLDDATKKKMEQDDNQIKRQLRDPAATMEARHQQVREKRAQREAEREAKEEARRKQQKEDTRRKREAQKQEELLQQEMVKLRRQLEERKRREQLLRQREREKWQSQTDTKYLQPAFLCCPKQEQPDTEKMKREQKMTTMIHMQNLKCVQRHLSAWYSVVLDQKLRLNKATALCDWKRMLGVWRAWRAAVWEEKKRREMARTEQELQKANRHNQLAVEHHRQRLLRRCLTEWHLWCRMEKKQREILGEQQEIQRKVAALLGAVSTAKVKAADEPNGETVDAPPELPKQPESSEKAASEGSSTHVPNTSAVPHKQTAAVRADRPTRPRVTRRHTAPTDAQVQQARHKVESQNWAGAKRTAAVGKHGSRNTVHREIIRQQRKQLREQQEQIVLLTEKQKIKGLEVDMERMAQLEHISLLGGSRPGGGSEEPAEEGEQRVPAEPRVPQRKAATHSHPIITAMEARARQRAQRRKQIEDLKRKKEEEKLAEMKAAQEQQQQEREEEKRKVAERRKEEKRLEKEREEERQKELRRHQELLKVAHQHHNRALLRRGLAPWKRLVGLQQEAAELAERHCKLSVLRRCTLAWQRAAKDSLSQKRASADRLHRHCLLRQGLSGWKRLMYRRAAEELRAAAFHRTCTLRKFLSALAAYVTREKLRQWDHQELAQKHSHRRTLQRCLGAWRTLPGLQRQQREKELRRERLSKKVAEVLPNFYSYLHSARSTGEGDEQQSDSSDTCV